MPDKTQQKETKVTKNLILEDLNWIFVFFVAFCVKSFTARPPGLENPRTRRFPGFPVAAVALAKVAVFLIRNFFSVNSGSLGAGSAGR